MTSRAKGGRGELRVPECRSPQRTAECVKASLAATWELCELSFGGRAATPTGPLARPGGADTAPASSSAGLGVGRPGAGLADALPEAPPRLDRLADAAVPEARQRSSRGGVNSKYYKKNDESATLSGRLPTNPPQWRRRRPLCRAI